MSYPTDLFGPFPTESTGDDAGQDPAATAPGPVPHEGAHGRGNGLLPLY